MKTKIILSILLLVMFINQSQGSDKSAAIGQTLDVIRAIHVVASQKSLTQDEAKARIQKSIDTIRAPEQLVKIAVISSAISYPGDVADENFDNCFDDAFWICVQKLTSIKGKIGADALDEIKRLVPLDGGDKLSLDAFIAKQKGEKPVY